MSNHFALSLEAPPENTFALSPVRAWTLLLLVFAAVHVAALFAPPLLDDADATHATAAQYMARSGDWVTLKVDGIRYLEKPPLPYWLAAADYRLFGFNVFATHLPLTLGVLGLAILAWAWGRRAYGERAAFYAALSILTSAGVFLFTRIFIPEVLLTLLLAFALYNFLIGLEDEKPSRFYLTWAALALAMLAKGLVAPVFFFLAAVPYLLLTGDWRRWRQFRLLSGILLFLAIAAPWHILAGLRNPGRRSPRRQYSHPGQCPRLLLFLLHQRASAALPGQALSSRLQQASLCSLLESAPGLALSLEHLPAGRSAAGVERPHSLASRLRPAPYSVAARSALFRARTTWLLAIYAAVILLFFSLSTNQEYYTFPVYFPLLLLTAGALASEESEPGRRASGSPEPRRHLPSLVWLPLSRLATAYGPRARLPSGSDIGALARASGRGRLHALDVSFIRSHRAILCRAAPARGAGCCRSSAGPGDRLGAASAAAPFRGHGQRRLHLRCISYRRAYCPGAL